MNSRSASNWWLVLKSAPTYRLTLRIAFLRYAPQLAKGGSGSLELHHHSPHLPQHLYPLRRTSRMVHIDIGTDPKKSPIPTFFTEYLSSSVLLQSKNISHDPGAMHGNPRSLTPSFFHYFPSWRFSILPKFPWSPSDFHLCGGGKFNPSTPSIHLFISSSIRYIRSISDAAGTCFCHHCYFSSQDCGEDKFSTYISFIIMAPLTFNSPPVETPNPMIPASLSLNCLFLPKQAAATSWFL